jgi:hypothetical protein
MRQLNSFCSCARFLYVTAAMAIVVSAIGCNSEAEQTAKAQEESRLKPIGILLGKHMRDMGGKPVNEEAFKKYLEQLPQAKDMMANAGAATVDEFLTSRRDGKKFVIIYRGMEGKVTGDVWAYEAEGVDGQRVVLDSLATTKLVPEEEFRKLVPSGS